MKKRCAAIGLLVVALAAVDARVAHAEDSKVAAEALRHGAGAYLPEPFDPRHVETLVATFFDSAKRRESKPNASR